MIFKNNANNGDTFINRLKSCLVVHAKYKEAFRALRDSLGGNQALNGFQVGSSSGFDEMRANPNAIKDNSLLNKSLPKQQLMTLNARRNSGDVSNASRGAGAAGILMSDETAIFSHIDSFCARVRNVLEQIVGLAQFQSLYKQASLLPRPKRDDYAYGTIINGRFVASKNAAANDADDSDEDEDGEKEEDGDDDDEDEGRGADIASENKESEVVGTNASSSRFGKSRLTESKGTTAGSEKSSQPPPRQPTGGKRKKKAGKTITRSDSEREDEELFGRKK
jgi:hypothetical protein